ncbi:MAG: MFS transporter [Woeseiaceae bacterium]
MAVLDNRFSREFGENWRILTVAFFCLLFAFSAPAFMLPFLYPEVIREFGWSREQAVVLASWKYITGSIVAIVVGRFIDVIGVRRVLIFVTVLGGLAMLSFLWTPNLSVYYIAGIMLGFSGAGTMVSIKVLISRTFHASQATAMGVAMVGTGVGSILVPFAAVFLIEAWGWRAGVALLSAGVWLIALPLMIFLLTDRSFDNRKDDASAPVATIDWGVVRGLAAQRRFWLIFFAVFAVGFVDQSLIQHQVLYFQEDLGLDPTYVAAIIGGIGVIAIITRPLVGGLFDGMSMKGVSLAYVALGLSCLFALVVLNPYLLAMFVVFRAVGHSAVLLDTLVLTKHTFGLRNIGILLGIFTAAVNLGFAAGPPVVARLYTMTGSYAVPFTVCAAIAVIAALTLLPLKPKYWPHQPAASPAGPGSR